MEGGRQRAQQKIFGGLSLTRLEKERPFIKTVDLLTRKLFEGSVHRPFPRSSG